MSGVLAIDTASDTVAVAYQEDGTAAVVASESRPREHSTSLLRLIDRVCEGNRGHVRAIVVVRGPGAYAGIRVGIATAQGLSIALGVALVGIDTLRAIAEAAWQRGETGLVTAVHPAGRGDFAAQEFAPDGSASGLTLMRPPFAGTSTVAGEGAAAYGGIEIGGPDRVLGALAAYRRGATSPNEALYVREPHITLARMNAAPTPGDPGRGA